MLTACLTFGCSDEDSAAVRQTKNTAPAHPVVDAAAPKPDAPADAPDSSEVRPFDGSTRIPPRDPWDTSNTQDEDANKAPREAGPPPDAGAEAGGPWLPLPATDAYEGRTLEEWVVEWARWTYAQTSCEDPFFDDDGSLCALYQDPDGPIFHLAKGVGDPQRTKCRIPSGKAILVPLPNLIGDNAGVAPEDILTEEDLEAVMAGFVLSMRELVLVVDGQPISNLEAYTIGPTRFSYVLPPAPNNYSCSGVDGVEGLVDPSYVAGVFVLLPPPSAGVHSLTYGGTGTLFGLDSTSVASSTFVVE
jgi:hypothetical protein